MLLDLCFVGSFFNFVLYLLLAGILYVLCLSNKKESFTITYATLAKISGFFIILGMCLLVVKIILTN